MRKKYKEGDIWISDRGHYRIAIGCYPDGGLHSSMNLSDYIIENTKLQFEGEERTIENIIGILQDRMIRNKTTV
jgi:hypothetical protein